MYKTTKHETVNRITVDISTLQSMLCVGRQSAVQIAKDAGAVLHIGRRTLYNVPKIEKYIESLTEA
jgi:hypothetical protein